MLKRFGWLIVAAWVSLLCLPARAQASTSDFLIKSFVADYYLSQEPDKSATMRVNERIVAEFPDYDQNHGLLRAIPERYQNHTLSLQLLSVTDDNHHNWHYTSSKDHDNLVLKIGDANRYVHGRQVYNISYNLRNPIDFVKDIQGEHQELYWDVNGDQWDQPFEHVQANVLIEPPADNGLDGRFKCFAGAFGQQGGDCSAAKTDEGRPLGTLYKFDAENLNPAETLTFVIGFRDGTFVQGQEVEHEKTRHKLFITFAVGAGLLPPAIVAMFMFRRWRQFGNDPKGRGIIIPEYEPPAGFNVLSSRFMLNYTVDQRAFSAAIIQLAVMGYLTIYETKQQKRLARDKPDYELELKKDTADLPDELRKVVDILFDDGLAGDRIKLSEFRKSHTNIYSDINDLRKDLAKQLTDGGYFQKDPTKVRSGYIGWAAAVFFISFGLVFVWPLTIVAAGGLLSGIVLFFFAFIMPARTAQGVQAHDDLLGLRDYIKLAEADRLKYLQSANGAEKIEEPDKFNPKTKAAKVKLFEKLLPYAMLFNLEKSWANQFKDIYVQPPDWYHGNVGTFNALYLSNSLNSFASASSVSFSSPSSSSGSGFSSGGGFSGGGGGGGGGGGW